MKEPESQAQELLWWQGKNCSWGGKICTPGNCQGQIILLHFPESQVAPVRAILEPFCVLHKGHLGGQQNSNIK